MKFTHRRSKMLLVLAGLAGLALFLEPQPAPANGFTKDQNEFLRTTETSVCDEEAVRIIYDLSADAFFLERGSGRYYEMLDRSLAIGYHNQTSVDVKLFVAVGGVWDVTVTHSDSARPVEVYETDSNGKLIYMLDASLDDEPMELELHPGGQTLPTPPDIVLSPQPACPPPPIIHPPDDGGEPGE